jgi:ankyrin repeat protein
MYNIRRMSIKLNKKLPQEINDMILMKLSTRDIRRIGRDRISDYVWWRKCHGTIEEAVREGNLIGVKYLIRDHLKTRMEKVEFITILFQSIDNGHLHIFKYLIEKYEVNINIDNCYLLIRGIKSGHLDIVKYIVEKGADIHVLDNYALQLSAEYNHIEIFKYLIERGADIYSYADYILLLSAANGHLEFVKYLVEQGANIHAYGNGALRRSSINGHLEVVKYLIEHSSK